MILGGKLLSEFGVARARGDPAGEDDEDEQQGEKICRDPWLCGDGVLNGGDHRNRWQQAGEVGEREEKHRDNGGNDGEGKGPTSECGERAAWDGRLPKDVRATRALDAAVPVVGIQESRDEATK